MSEQDLGPKPEAQIEPGEPNPGGVDAITDPDIDTTVPDLSPDLNPATSGDSTPDEVREGEDTSTEATRGDGHDLDTDVEPETEAPV